jgi:hypothetical protein
MMMMTMIRGREDKRRAYLIERTYSANLTKLTNDLIAYIL